MGSAAFAIALGAALAGVAGCTLLVSFDAGPEVEVVDTDSGTGIVTPSDAQTQAPTDSGSSTLRTDARAAGFPPECKAPQDIVLCGQSGLFCGRRFTDYPDDKENDLLKCEGDIFKAITCMARCPSGCLNVNGFDDQCDPCQGVVDGTYCGRDVGWTKRNADVSIVCKSGKAASTAAGCK